VFIADPAEHSDTADWESIASVVTEHHNNNNIDYAMANECQKKEATWFINGIYFHAFAFKSSTNSSQTCCTENVKISICQQ